MFGRVLRVLMLVLVQAAFPLIFTEKRVRDGATEVLTAKPEGMCAIDTRAAGPDSATRSHRAVFVARGAQSKAELL